MNPLRLISLFLIFTSMIPTALIAEVVINDDKVIEINNETILKIDDDIVTETEFEQEAEGHMATVFVTNSSSFASEININNPIKGPVTSISPFQVFGQDVVIDAATVLVNNNGTFSLDELLEVSGSFNDSAVVIASRVERKSDLETWKLMGHLQQVNGNLITIGEISFDISGVIMDDCSAILEVGDLVKIKVNPIENFSSQDTISNNDILEFECKTGVVDLPDDLDDNLEFEIEGFVSEIIDSDNFKLNGLQVMVSSTTSYFNGTKDDIIKGVKLEAEGFFDTNTNILIADKIKFKNIPIRIEGPVQVNDLTEEQITIMGITGIITAFTEDDDLLIDMGLSTAINIEVRGYIDSSGSIFVEKIRERGDADNTDTRLRGPISNLDTLSFDLLGVTVNTEQSSFFIEEQPVDEATFYAALADGNIVDINHGLYDAETNTISSGEVTLEEADDKTETSMSKGVDSASASNYEATSSVIYGTITTFTAAQTAPVPVPTTAPVTTPVAQSTGGGGSTSLFIMVLLVMGFTRRR